MHFKCTKEGAGQNCFKKIQEGSCPCIASLKLYSYPMVLDSGLCILAIQTSLENHCYLLIHRKSRKIFFYHSQAMTKEIKKTFPGYGVYPAIKGGKKCLP